MKKRKTKGGFKTALCLVLALAMCAGLMPSGMTAFAADDAESDGAAYSVTLNQTAGGTLSFADADGNCAEFFAGDEVTFYAQPEDGNVLGRVYVSPVDGETYTDDGATGLESYSFTMPDCDVIITATFIDAAEAAMGLEYGDWDPMDDYDPYGISTLAIAMDVWGKELYFEKSDSYVSYGDYNTHEMHVSTGSSTTGSKSSGTSTSVNNAYCIEPFKYAPAEGDKTELYHSLTEIMSESKAEKIRKVLWYAYDAPGCDESLWNTNNGAYSLLTSAHTLMAYIYGGEENAFYGSSLGLSPGAAYISWAEEYLISDTNTYSTYYKILQQPDPPDSFEVYALCEGSYQIVVFWDYEPDGYLTLEKSSENPSITDGNSCYSFEGAVYWVYTDSDCTERAMDADGKYVVLMTDEYGHANTVEMEVGKYYAKEVTAPKGYELEEVSNPKNAIHIVEVTANNTENEPAVITVTECPANDPGNINIYKEDAETGEMWAQGAASLEGAQFTVCYYDYDGDDYESYVESHDPTRTWVIETKYSETRGEYYATLGSNWKVSGDDFYYDDGAVALPLGTYTIQETKAPEGYLIEGDFTYTTSGNEKKVGKAGEVFVTQLLYDDDLMWEIGGNYYTQEERVKRGDFEFEKKNGETQERMANIPFSITSTTTGESHIVYTDANGYYGTSTNYIPHSENTNSDEPNSGVWFGLNSDGTNVPVDDSLGALPYDTYVVEELPCDENDGLKMISFTVTVTRDNWLIDYGTEENWPEEPLSIHTMAWAGDTGTQFCNAEDQWVTLYDNVYYTGLTPGETYYIYGIALDSETREPELDAEGNKICAVTSFVADESGSGMEVQTFYFDMENLSNRRVVFFETIYQLDEDGNAVLVIAEDPEDYEAQTIYFPGVGTTLTEEESGEHVTLAGDEVTVVDMVTVTEIPEGTECVIRGTLMDKETGEPITDEDGNPVTASVSFVSAGLDEQVFELSFTFDASLLTGNGAVAFEELYLVSYPNDDRANGPDEILIGEHANLDDADQTVMFPDVATTLTEEESGAHCTIAGNEVTVVDMVTVTGVPEGTECVIRGTLMQKSTGKALKDADGNEITAEASFVSTGVEAQVIELAFVFDASALTGDGAVAFEDLYMLTYPETYDTPGGDDEDAPDEDAPDPDETLIGQHEDLDDTDQTVTFPEIFTTATDAEDGEKTVAADKITINDEVFYYGLTPGETYRMHATIMDKETGEPLVVNGETVTAEVEFVAEEADGSVIVPISFDATGLDGKHLVAFEKAYIVIGDVTGDIGEDADTDDIIVTEYEVANHEDINDPDQTVFVSKDKTGRITTSTNAFGPKTGDMIWPIVLAIVIAAAVVVLIVVLLIQRKKKVTENE